MAEYIDRIEAMNIIAGGKNDNAYFGTTSKDWEVIDFLKSVPPAHVIELKPILEEYEELVQTNPTSKQVDEFCVKTMRRILCDYYVEKL